MPSFNESGLIITLPEGSWFRFADQPTYKRLCAHSIKEMDYGCYASAKNCIELFELKDYSRHLDLPSHLVDNLVAKGRDSIVLLHSAWSNRGEGRVLRGELPDECRSESPLRLYFVVKMAKTHVAQFATIRDHVRTRVRVYASVLGLSVNVQALDHHTAIKYQLPIAEMP